MSVLSVSHHITTINRCATQATLLARAGTYVAYTGHMRNNGQSRLVIPDMPHNEPSNAELSARIDRANQRINALQTDVAQLHDDMIDRLNRIERMIEGIALVLSDHIKRDRHESSE